MPVMLSIGVASDQWFGFAGRSPLVVGVDSSDSARHAGEWAAVLASVWRVPLQLVNASAGAGEPATAATPPWLRELVDAAELLGAEPAGAEVVAGGVADVLLHRSTDAGLVVVGSYGEGAQGGVLAGSTALALVARAGCPVAALSWLPRSVPGWSRCTPGQTSWRTHPGARTGQPRAVPSSPPAPSSCSTRG
jgi:nucleotide-binding universal stress UspA family protein